jgi:hypothetical protein
MGNQCRVGFGAGMSILLNWFCVEISEYQLLGNEMHYEVIKLLSHYLQVSLTIETNKLVYFRQLCSNFNNVFVLLYVVCSSQCKAHIINPRCNCRTKAGPYLLCPCAIGLYEKMFTCCTVWPTVITKMFGVHHK